MSLRYLQRAVTGATTQTGFVQLQLTPDYGQFWAPRIIRVGMNLSTVTRGISSDPDPIIGCTIYHGAQGDINLDAFVDSTWNGASGDITSIMNGILIQPGEYLTAFFQRRNLTQIPNIPNATAYLEIDGLVSDTLNDVSELTAASVPGARFQGQPPSKTFPPPAADQRLSFSFQNPGAGNNVTIIPTSNVSIYLYELTWQTNAAVNGGDGYFYTSDFYEASPMAIIYDNPFNTSGIISIFPRVIDFHGMRSSGGGLAFHQQGAAAANAFQYVGAITYRQPSPLFN